jgi:tRNA threonylcarbamoyladenosine biosynthesis protein TsaE
MPTVKPAIMAAPHPRSPTLDLLLPDKAATAALAARIAARAQAGDVIALYGDLGTGKTAFARAFIGALAPGPEPSEVPSPTFTLLQCYDRIPAPVWHFDLYRLARPDEVYELGFEEALAEAISLIEWPDRMGPLLPADRLEVHLSYAEPETARRAVLIGAGTWAPRLAELGGDD